MRFMKIENAMHIPFTQDMLGVFLAIKMSALRSHVAEIIGMTSKKKMFWVYTPWIVACMANKKTVFDLSVVHFI